MGVLNYLFGWTQLDIRRSDLVLEVGSGGHPLLRSDVLCDKFVVDDLERRLGRQSVPLAVDRPFVCGDAEALPFRDRSFDYLVCSHTLEHLDHPLLFLREAMRVAHKGLIVTPNELSERLFGSEKHKHLIALEDGTLVITQKTRDNWGWFGGFFHELYVSNTDFKRFFQRNSRLFETRLQWHGSIPYAYRPVEAPLGFDGFARAAVRLSTGGFDGEGANEPRAGGLKFRTTAWSRSQLSRLLGPLVGRHAVDLRTVVVCPVCHGSIDSLSGHSATCVACGRRYPIVNGIAFLLNTVAQTETA